MPEQQICGQRRQGRDLRHLGALQRLESLSVGVYSLTDFGFLNDIPASISVPLLTRWPT